MKGFKFFNLYRYLNEDGTFNYDEYVQAQIETNKRKIRSVWITKQSVITLSAYIKSLIPDPKFGICHGTRNGKEQRMFRNHLGCEVIGTEISDTAEDFPFTIQWDFHEVKEEWIDSVDFIYSNSIDHAYDPEKCLNAWMSCLRKGGICILEYHSVVHGPSCANKSDPFGANVFIMPYLITLWGDGRYGVRQILDMGKRGKRGTSYSIIIQKFGGEDG